MQFHKNHEADLTIALKKLEKKLAYGIVDVGDDMLVSNLTEKPHITFLINSGIYVLSPQVLSLIPDNGKLPMTELIGNSLEAGMRVKGYEFTEKWIDIGRLGNYMRTLEALEAGHERDTEMVFMWEDDDRSQASGSKTD
jgi:NDP-sugar pyrophosphorylase family protein